MEIKYQDSKRGGVFFMEDQGRRLAEITYQSPTAHREAETAKAHRG